MRYSHLYISFLFAFLIWLGPFALSFLFYDKYGNTLLDPTLASVIYTVFFFILFFYFLKVFIYKYPKKPFYTFYFSLITFFVSTILDLIFLIGLFGVSWIMFVSQILPIYLLVIFMGCFAARIQFMYSK